jgi:hypothetical protein
MMGLYIVGPARVVTNLKRILRLAVLGNIRHSIWI